MIVIAKVTWAKGGEAGVVSLKDDAIVLRSTVPSPPGSRIEGAIEGAAAMTLRVKVHSSKKQPDGGFLLEGRVLDLTKGLRERLSS